MVHHPIDVARMMREAGWTNKLNRTIAVAVCWAESRFDDQAINENLVNGEVDSVDVGLMQINSKWQPQVTRECALDPVCNLAAAYEIYKGRGYSFSAWNAWRDSKHVPYLEQAAIAVEAEIRLRKQARDFATREDELVRQRDELLESLNAARLRLSNAEARFRAWAEELRARIFDGSEG